MRVNTTLTSIICYNAMGVSNLFDNALPGNYSLLDLHPGTTRLRIEDSSVTRARLTATDVSIRTVARNKVPSVMMCVDIDDDVLVLLLGTLVA